ncbi:MAG TPA: phosphatidylglycerophosphatase A [Candidatus Acidoferrales bacterium]|nr:phosphatidylglycerophosphatase A [Candidatus Acidoferrales bacterium]
MNPKTDFASLAHVRKPHLSFFFATAAYVGYLPKAPGTWGSLVGMLLYALAQKAYGYNFDLYLHDHYYLARALANRGWLLAAIIAIVGVAASTRVARFAVKKDPQIVVIDEVSGQFSTYLLALARLNWKYLVLGFILFRVFDIWKPFPVRQAESLPGGWGIMADDWVAAIYAAIGIWIARALGL